MSRNYVGIHYIQEQLKEFNPKFVDCVIRCFNRIEEIHEHDGCLSNSIALYICAKEYGYSPILCYGLCSYEGVDFYHAWLEINGIVIDIAIYGNVNYSPLLLRNNNIAAPYIGKYKNNIVYYGKFKFDDEWKASQLSQAEGLTFEQYINGAPHKAMWTLICKLLDKTPMLNTLKRTARLASAVRAVRFKRCVLSVVYDCLFIGSMLRMFFPFISSL